MKAIAFALGLLSGVAHAQCDTALLLLMDVSTSVEADEYEQQVSGTASALQHPEIIAAMTSGIEGMTMVGVMQWSTTQAMVVPWRTVRSEADAEAVAAELRQAPRTISQWTHTGDAIAAAIVVIDAAPMRCDRTIIDLSTDGTPNGGQMIPPLRVAIEMRGWTLNGLGIEADDKSRTITQWLEEDVIAGIGSFARRATFETYAEAIRAKLIKEVASR